MEKGVAVMDLPSPKLWESAAARRNSNPNNYRDSTMRSHDLTLVSSWISVPLILFIASQNYTLGTITSVIISLILAIVNSSSIIKHSTIKVFLKGWACSSFFTQMCIFQFETVGYLEILFYENALLTVLVALACYYMFQAKYVAQTNYKIIKKETLKSFSNKWNCANCTHTYSHHYYICSWLNICIIRKNFKYFSYFLMFLSLGCFYAANLTLTTICFPRYLLGNYFLVPYNCSDVYRDLHASLSFTSAVYFILIGLYCVYLLILNTFRFVSFTIKKELPT